MGYKSVLLVFSLGLFMTFYGAFILPLGDVYSLNEMTDIDKFNNFIKITLAGITVAAGVKAYSFFG